MAKKNRHYVITRKFSVKVRKKLVGLFVAIILAFLFLLSYIVYINAKDGSDYIKIVLNQQQYTSRIIPYKRGEILDRNGIILAESERVYNLIFDVKVMTTREATIGPSKKVLMEFFEIEEEVIEELIEKRPESRYNILLRGLNYEKAKEFEEINNDKENYPNVTGIWLEEDYVRKYPYKTLASDVVGFTSRGTEGRIGLEAMYNSVLNGMDGKQHGYFNANSALETSIKPAIGGDSIVTTLDMNLHYIVEKHVEAFNKEHENGVITGPGSQNTAVLIMNPNTGEILAQTDYPNFDLNKPGELSAFYTSEELETMEDEEKSEYLNKLWQNFSISHRFEPGSTMKPFTVAMGFENGKIIGDETYYCDGALMIQGGEEPVKCHLEAGHGMQSVGVSVANSCNVALMHMSEVIGRSDFLKYQHVFGLGERTGIDLPSETRGLLKQEDAMQMLDLATNSFGQNFESTMIQIAAGFSSLINGGNYYQPYIVRQIVDENGNVIDERTPLLLKRTISEDTSELIKDYLRMVVTEGTGKNTAIDEYDIGGKTGTAETYPRENKEYITSFIGCAPQENPEIVIYVVINRPNVIDQDASVYVTTLARNIMEEVFPYLNITKKEQVEE